MMKSERCLFLLLLFSLCWGPAAGKADTGEWPQGTKEYPLRVQNVNTGLSNNTVHAVGKDKYGFLWIGTENGLNRFDSRQWMHYFFNPADPTGLSNSKVLAILPDRLGRLWIGTAKGLNLFSFETNTFRRVPGDTSRFTLPGQYIRCLFQDSDGDIWVGSSDGLSVIRGDSPGIRITNRILGDGAEGENNIVTVYEDSRGLIWIGTGNGLFYTRNKQDFYRFRLGTKGQDHIQNLQVRAIIEIGDVLLFATETNGLYASFRGNGAVEKIRVYSNGAPMDLIYRDLFFDRDSCLWIASTVGLFRTDQGIIPLQRANGLKLHGRQILDNSVRVVFQDENQGVWIGTQYNGLYYHYSDNFLFSRMGFSPRDGNGLSNAVVSAFLVQQDSVWIGTDGGGLNLWIRSRNRILHWTESDGLVNDNIKSLAKDSDGHLWIGTFKGLSILRGKSFTNFNLEDILPDSPKTPSNHFLSIYIEPGGKTAWLGTDGYGLVKAEIPGMKFTPVSVFSRDFKASSVNTILPEGDSLLVLGTSSGLYVYNLKSGEFSQQRIPLAGSGEISPYIICAARQGESRVWLGTEKYGLILYDMSGKKAWPVDQFREIPGIVINAVHQIGQSDLWCSTNQGLNHIVYEFSDDSLYVRKCTFYAESYGVQSKQFMPRSSFLSDEGELFFGSIDGFNYFFPAQIRDESTEIPILVKGLSYWDSRENKLVDMQGVYPAGKHFTFEFYIRDITLDFIGINYSHPEDTRYAYRFAENGEKWIDLGNRNLISFNHLSNGDYNIEINAYEYPDTLSGEGTVLGITILPPLWRSGYAIAFYSFTILLLLYLFYRTITRWERMRSNLELEHLRREQDEQLHEQRIRFFTDISHELRTPLTLILSPIDMIINKHSLPMRVMNTLQMVRQNGERMLQLINQLLDLRKADAGHLKFRASRGNLVRFLQEVMLSFRDLALTKDITLDFRSKSDTIEAYYDRDKLEIVVTNLLSNALKHTPESGMVTLSIEEHPDPADAGTSKFPDGFVQVIIEDTGKGIPADRIDRIFDRFFEENSGIKGIGIGLELSKNYVELHGGTISVESRVEEAEKQGFTRFTIRLPLGRRHLRDDQIAEDFVGSEDIKAYIAPGQKARLHPDLESEIEKIPFLEEGKGGRYRLVIVEDNQELRNFLIRMLADKYRVSGAENGKSGWDMILKEPPDLIISDIMMPEMDGIELCRKIKTDIRTSHIPVILLTARTAITFKYEGLETGADEYITKPFHAEYLALKIRNLIYQREMVRRKFLKESITDPEVITLTSMDERLLQKAIDYMHKHMGRGDLSIESISDHLGMSRVHFYRKIKAIAGVTPQEFLRTVRLKYAASLISQKKLRIAEVAYMCGFKDPAYFSKSFKKFYGVSPSEFSGKPS